MKDLARPDSFGRYGQFGGKYVPETLMAALDNLEKVYNETVQDPAFQAEFQSILKDYVGRESPLYFAERLTEHYSRPDPADPSRRVGPHVYLKREDLNHTGAHKINNAIGQVLLAKRIGKKRIIAETGAGQHGVATATVCARFGLNCIVYMGAEDMRRQALNVFRMRLLGAEVRAVHSGTRTLKDATSEAIRDWVTNVDTTHYILGSAAGPHPYPMIVRDFQAIIGREAKKQSFEKFGRLPDVLVACVGGGSNAMGLFHEFVEDEGVRMVGVEAAGHGVHTDKHAATLTAGEVGVLHGAMSYLLQDSDGQIIEPHSISAGLDYPGVGPEHSFLKDIGRAEYFSVTDDEALQAFKRVSRLEGIIPALETSHALAYLEYLCPQLADGTKDNGIKRLKLFGADVDILRALVGTDIEVAVMLQNEYLNLVAGSQKEAAKWLSNNVSPFVCLMLVGTDIEVAVMLQNEYLNLIAGSQKEATKWLSNNVSPFVFPKGANIREIAVGNDPFLQGYQGMEIAVGNQPFLQGYQGVEIAVGNQPFLQGYQGMEIAVGNEPFLQSRATKGVEIAVGNEPFLQGYQGMYESAVVPAMRNMYSALQDAKLDDKIKLTVPLNADILGSSYPPSSGEVRGDILEDITAIADILKQSGGTFSINIYPFLTLHQDTTGAIGLNQVFLGQPGGQAWQFKDPKSGLKYDNIFDGAFDAVVAALEKIGYGDLPIEIGEIGWPSDGQGDMRGYATVDNAYRFNQAILAHMLSGTGTPARPNQILSGYLFALSDEDRKITLAGPFERHWGIFRADGTPKYPLDLTGGGKNVTLKNATGIVLYPGRWCVAKEDADPQKLAEAVTYACGDTKPSDCTPAQVGGSCYFNGSTSKVATYAFNSYFQLNNQSEQLESLFKLGKKLGQGQFGVTFLCTEKATGKEYACKTIAKKKLISREDVEDVKREVAIMHHLSGHNNIVCIKGAYEDHANVHIVMELCTGGELFERIIKKGHYSERQAAELTRTIAKVIEACHSLGVIHRDLKPENFLFANKSETADLKATDFGLSYFFKPGEYLSDVVGSPYYVAPEVLRRRYNEKADVWSMGVIIYILLSGVPPFWAETEQGIFEAVLRGELDFESDPWPSISEDSKDLIRHMCCLDPKKRYSAYDVLCHPWVAKDGVAPDKPLGSAVLSRLKQFTAMNKLKKMALRVIAESMSEEEISGLKETFKMMDTDGSGTITYEELRAGLKRIGSTLNDMEIKELMDAADIDGNGTIDYGEFLAATVQLNKIEREETLFAAFSYFDKDSSGFISTDELQDACREYGVDEECIVETMRDVDTNNDGIIDYNEFVAMMRQGNGGIGRKSLGGSWTSGNLFRDLVSAGQKAGPNSPLASVQP
ncbi:unnamed protein product [Closterium sp. NIES-64]|nr:unnamed protein product [Closterium sp. NIES-64]